MMCPGKMKSFREIFDQNKKILSLEFFPPKKEDLLKTTETLMSELAVYNPDFMTVTYGAGGGTRSFSKRLVSFIANQLKITSVAHLTCVGHSSDEIKEIVSSLQEEGVHHILALRGDPPKGEETFKSHPEGFNNARELTSFIRSTFCKKEESLSLAVAGYPEVHSDAKSEEEDLQYLKSKVDAGAELIITQLFFDSKIYFDFCKKAEAIGITIPILPGIMPIQNVAQLERFTSMCGAHIPKDLHDELKTIQHDDEAVIEFGISYAIQQITDLINGGAPGIHLYTLNKSRQIVPIIESISSLLETSINTSQTQFLSSAQQ